jgi:hypothetical protein
MRWLLLCSLAALARASADVAVSATVAAGVHRLSRTSFTSGTTFVVDQSDATNAGYPFWLNLAGAAPGWDATHACPSGPCDAATYAVERAKAGSTGAFSITYNPSTFQSKSVAFGTPGGAASGTLSFSLPTQPSYWVYSISLGILGITAGVNIYAISLV